MLHGLDIYRVNPSTLASPIYKGWLHFKCSLCPHCSRSSYGQVTRCHDLYHGMLWFMSWSWSHGQDMWLQFSFLLSRDSSLGQLVTDALTVIVDKRPLIHLILVVFQFCVLIVRSSKFIYIICNISNWVTLGIWALLHALQAVPAKVWATLSALHVMAAIRFLNRDKTCWTRTKVNPPWGMPEKMLKIKHI